MPRGTKRTLTARTSTKLAARVSDLDLQDDVMDTDAPRRSKRVKIAVKKEDNIYDIEDLGGIATPRRSPQKKDKIIRARKSGDVTGVAEGSSTAEKNAISTPRKSKTKFIPQARASGTSTSSGPPNWRETYDIIKQMRTTFIAPVDTMGCQLAQDGETEPKNKPYATLVSLMLSSQTTDQVVTDAINKLRKALGGSISIEAMIAADDATVKNAISKVGFNNKKLEYLKQAAITLRDKFNSDVPNTVKELCSIKGVGPKMAFLTLQMAWKISDGIGVDTHLHKISNRLGWHRPQTKEPEQTRINLQSWLPQELYGDINHMMVGFGQVICLPVSPRCDICTLGKNDLCPSAERVVNIKQRKPIVFLPTPANTTDVSAKIEIALEDDIDTKPDPGS